MSEEIEYEVTETVAGIWRRYRYDNGNVFAEYVSHAKLLNWRVVHITYGLCPETNRRIMAKGIIAIGRRAIGVLAIGQLSIGVIAIGQLAIGLLFGIGQATTGVIAVGQAAIGVAMGLGQLATGWMAVGQVSCGFYALGQVGYGTHVWDSRGVDPVAKQFFQSLF